MSQCWTGLFPVEPCACAATPTCIQHRDPALRPLLHARHPSQASHLCITLAHMLVRIPLRATTQGLTVFLMLVTSLGSTIFWALGASMVFVGAHAVTHKTEFHQVEAADFGGVPPADQV